jgi:hypothetical protein
MERWIWNGAVASIACTAEYLGARDLCMPTPEPREMTWVKLKRLPQLEALDESSDILWPL